MLPLSSAPPLMTHHIFFNTILCIYYNDEDDYEIRRGRNGESNNDHINYNVSSLFSVTCSFVPSIIRRIEEVVVVVIIVIIIILIYI